MGINIESKIELVDYEIVDESKMKKVYRHEMHCLHNAHLIYIKVIFILTNFFNICLCKVWNTFLPRCTDNHNFLKLSLADCSSLFSYYYCKLGTFFPLSLYSVTSKWLLLFSHEPTITLTMWSNILWSRNWIFTYKAK